ncbi:MAG: sigma-70 family RNA polymerase sigma factor [Planctomicrobium sp.]|jgi:RNA polymerase sigma-70 factor, ECF subfamily|nr:sigma-70 family RNA polymerase sigma factor [Planctomicrobium sp.]
MKTKSPLTSEYEALLEQGTQASDARLVEDAKKGNREAFGELVHRYESRLQRVIGRFVFDADITDDLSQETFIRVYEKLDQFDPARRFSPWLFRIGVNLTLDYLRKKKRRVWAVLFTDRSVDRWIETPDADPRPTQDLQQEVRATIQQIPEKYRTVLVLRDMENFSTSEIAAILDRKEATIRWRLAEARNRFQELWEIRQRQN